MGLCCSRLSPCGSPSVTHAPASVPLPCFPPCHMSDPVSAAPLPAFLPGRGMKPSDTEKNNTDKNREHAMCRPVSQSSPKPHTLSSLCPFSFYLCLFHSFTHTHTHSQQRANNLLASQIHHRLLVLSHLPYHLSERKTCGQYFLIHLPTCPTNPLTHPYM